MSYRAPAVSWKSGDGVPDQFPAGLRVLVVDDDPTCLLILEKMLKNCLYEVTKCNRAELALKLLRDNRDGYDVVISDVHMPDMDGFKLLEHVGLEMDLPVIMMSADDSKGVVMKGVTHGACDYLIKPVRMEALKNIWQHVVRKKKHELRDKDNNHDQQSGSVEDTDRHPKTSDDTENYSSVNEGANWKSSGKKRKDEDDEGGDERDDTSALKKPRVVWSVELHQQFVSAVNSLGIDKAVPKKILELMNVPGLTRENVASHLQKYRLYLKRLSVGQHQNVYGNPFGPDPTFGSISPLNGALDFQALASSSQIPPQSLATIQAGRAVTNRPVIPGGLVDQRNIFSFENPRKFIEGPNQLNNNNNKQVSLLHGVPTNVSLPIHPQSSQMVRSQVLNRPVQRHPMMLGRNGNSQPSSLNDFSSSQRMENTTFPLMGNTTSNYELFNNLGQNRNVDWALQSRGPTFDPPQYTANMQQARVDVAPSVLVQPGFSSDQRRSSTNVGQLLTSSTVDNSLSSIRPDMGFQNMNNNNNIFSERFVNEDLLNVFLKQPEGVAQGESDFGFDGYHLDGNLPV